MKTFRHVKNIPKQQLLLIAVLMLITLILLNSFRVIVSFQGSNALIQNTVAFEQPMKNASLRILVAGDTFALGVGAATSSESIAGRLGQMFPNASIGTVASPQADVASIQRTFNSLAENQFDIVILLVGRNDIITLHSLTELQIELDILLFRAQQIGTHVIAMTPRNLGLSPKLPWPIDRVYRQRSKEVSQLFLTAAETQQVIAIDLFADKRSDSFSTDEDKYYAEDGIHPSSDGYALLFDRLLATLKHENIVE